MSLIQRQVLVADDDQTILRVLEHTLKKAGYLIVKAANGREAIDLANDDYACALVDLNMPEADGRTVLAHFKQNHPDVPVIMMSGVNQVKEAVHAMKSGALEYLTKPINLDELVSLIHHASRMSSALQETRQWRQANMAEVPTASFAGTSSVARSLLGSIAKVASLESTVLITGESGVGKGLVARMIHAAGPHRNAPFVTVSCPAMPRELIESEMFGHEKGAFTGAHQRRIGRIEMAKGGTLFLDEIGDLPLLLQPKLLNVIQDRQFQRLGGKELLHTDVRMIAATNVDLQKKVALKEFREDLFYRLNVIPISIPPLRERVADLPPLCAQILGHIAASRHTQPYVLTEEALKVLMEYRWPGNVRQLENVLELASAFCSDQVLRLDDLPEEIRRSPVPSSSPSTTGSSNPGEPQIAGMALRDLEKLAIEQTLEMCGGNKASAARHLGITEKSIYNKMTRLRLR